jgi:hypothetical protein
MSVSAPIRRRGLGGLREGKLAPLLLTVPSRSFKACRISIRRSSFHSSTSRFPVARHSQTSFTLALACRRVERWWRTRFPLE